MRKSIKVVTAITLIASMLAMPVFAAEFVPSIELKDGPQLVNAILEDGDATVHFIPYGSSVDEEAINFGREVTEEMEQTVRESLKNATEELRNNPINRLVSGFEEVWERITDGAPVENAIVHDIFEIVMIGKEADGFRTNDRLTISFTVNGVSAEDLFVVIHKPTGSSEWIIEEHEIDENGVITIHPDSLSPFAIIKDSGKAPEATVTSPQTGVSDYTVAVSIAIVLSGFGIVCLMKSRRASAR